MSSRIICYTLFDITTSNVRRNPGADEDPINWLLRRNTQTNFDTIIQAISLRSQPELISKPVRSDIKFDDDKFGYMFRQIEDEVYPCWSFNFDIMHPGVFANEDSELGLVYEDCDMVPMIKCGTEWDKLPAFLDSSPELRNIYFTII